MYSHERNITTTTIQENSLSMRLIIYQDNGSLIEEDFLTFFNIMSVKDRN